MEPQLYSDKLITVVTASYNRAHLLVDLYNSLCRQTTFLFDWIVVDDGSTDETARLVQDWILSMPPFDIRLVHKENEGKNKAINDAVLLVSTPFAMIVDSDDYLVDYAISFLSAAAAKSLKDETLAGVAGMRGNRPDSDPCLSLDLGIHANNLERRMYHLEKDANEVYKTALLRSHPFDVWPGERFVPEETVWNQLALEGYSLMWYPLTTCVVRYQDEGMTCRSWAMLKNNPMGYAKLFNQRLVLPTSSSCSSLLYNTLQFVSCCFLGRNANYLFRCNRLLLALLLVVPGWLLSRRRKKQFAQYECSSL